jgi:hypothetical protein
MYPSTYGWWAETPSLDVAGAPAGSVDSVGGVGVFGGSMDGVCGVGVG